MRNFYFSGIFALLTLPANTQSQISMFRATPEHTSSFTLQNNFVFGDEAWKFNVDAPVRSTAVCNSSTVFFGSSKGILCAVDKKNGNIGSV